MDIIASVQGAVRSIQSLNPRHTPTEPARRQYRLQKVLVANRGEIAKRFFHSLREEGIPSIAIVTNPDIGQSWYAMADEAIFIGDAMNYTNIPVVIAAAVFTKANAIYPGYGFLSENATFVEAIAQTGVATGQEIIFMGPSAEIMRRVGDKLDARALAEKNRIPLFAGSKALDDAAAAIEAAKTIGYPVIVKLNAGGGGKGMQAAHDETELVTAIESCRRIGRQIYADDTFYLERLIVQPVHMEVQIFNGTAIGIRKCAVQRRNQKIVEESGDLFLSQQMNLSILAAAENMARISGYVDNAGAGTVEFLYDQENDELGFLEMNTRLQVEHPVTDQSLGVDLAKWQVLLFDGRLREIPFEQALRQRFTEKSHAIEARIYAEDTENNYQPAPGKILELDLPTFNGIRCDFGFSKGDSILPHYDPMIGKIIAKGSTRREALVRLERALSEFYIKGITTNTQQLLNVVRSADFQKIGYTNRLLADDPALARDKHSVADLQQAAVFGAITLNLRKSSELALNCIATRDLERVMHSGEAARIPEGFLVETGGHKFLVSILQTELEQVHAYIDGSYFGNIELLSRIPGNADYFVRYQSRSYHVRVDQRATQTILRLPDTKGKINYYRLKLVPLGGGERVDPPGMLRAPFQGTFVKFCGTGSAGTDALRPGTVVKKHQPLVVLSAMKMESTLCAQIDGKITYLLEGGDLSRLQLAKTGDGQIIGKNITEGEVLVEIEEENLVDPGAIHATRISPADSANDDTLANLYGHKLGKLLAANPARHLGVVIAVLQGYIHGYHPNDDLAQRLTAMLAQLPAECWHESDVAATEQLLSAIILHYCNIKYLFSATGDEASALLPELSKLFSQWGRDNYHPPFALKAALDPIFRTYGIIYWHPTQAENGRVEMAFLQILRSYLVCRNQPEIIRLIVRILGNLEKPSTRTIHCLRKLIMQEETERDDSLAEYATSILGKLGFRPWKQELGSRVSRQYVDDFRRMIRDPLTSFAGYDRVQILQQISKSLFKPTASLVPEDLAEWAARLVSGRLEILAREFRISRFYSPIANVLIYGLEALKDKNDTRYLSMALLDRIIPEHDEIGQITGSKNMEVANIAAAQVFMAYQVVEKRKRNWIEIIAAGEATEIDFAGEDHRIFNQYSIRRIIAKVSPFYFDQTLEKSIVTLKFYSRYHPEPGIEHLLISPRNSRLELSLLSEQDQRYPYGKSPASPKNQQLFDKGKWPVEFWAEHCFDLGSMREVKIAQIDQIPRPANAAGAGEFVPVGSRIYTGLLSGHKVCFYMKDSRINGGATGNLEGLKYLAACYIAFMEGCPLYVFNDGAGANIREGMIALNRAAEGFMLNALLRSEVSASRFFRWIDTHPDKKLTELFLALDQMFSYDRNTKTKETAYVVAVGIGSSTGLDVYGSSQAAIQLMIDSENSYRVLTGSNVIKSVTGENIGNYDIGGARIMDMHTGTVDLVAVDNLHLLGLIRTLQTLFAPENPRKAIPRHFSSGRSPVLISGIDVTDHVDHGNFQPFKENYYGSGSLVGGFARIGGRKVMLMGPRDGFGIRSFAAVTKGTELLTSARKTGASQIILCGEKWYRELTKDDSIVLRARQDFFQLLQQKSGVRIHVITHCIGLNYVALNCNADAVIAIVTADTPEATRQYANSAATHVVASATEAFNLALRLIDLLKSPKAETAGPSGIPAIPENPAQPFDMVESVIAPVFDEDSFVEYYGPMNDPLKGPCLITGLARLDGRTVAIIADQPQIMGGAPDAPGTEKFRIFTELMNRNNIPIIMLSNAPGFIPGTKQERLRIQQIGGLSLDVNVQSNVPVVSVVLNQNFGGRQIHAFSKYLRPGIVYIALRRAVMAVMGAQSSFDLFEAKKYAELATSGRAQAEEFRADYIRNYNQKAAAENDALQTGIVDWVFDDVKTLRAELIRGLQLAIERNNEAFGKHDE